MLQWVHHIFRTVLASAVPCCKQRRARYRADVQPMPHHLQARHRAGGLQVKSVNGSPVKNLEGLVAAVEACKEHFLRFQLEYSQVLLAYAAHVPQY